MFEYLYLQKFIRIVRPIEIWFMSAPYAKRISAILSASDLFSK